MWRDREDQGSGPVNESKQQYTRKEYEEYLSLFPSACGTVTVEMALSFEEWKEFQPEADEILGILKKVI